MHECNYVALRNNITGIMCHTICSLSRTLECVATAIYVAIARGYIQ